ncbi:MAG TPA: GNAT family N-acetyltransferase [Anaerolineae bacterium]|nr:GNAT family N-acetyltransferase [Anaerolineae bacterium]
MDSSLTFHPAERYSSDELGELFTRAYTGYPVPVQIDQAGLETMVITYDIDLGASRVAVLGGEPVAIALLSVRDRRGWIGGMGVVPARRRQGIGGAVMRAALDAARRRAIHTVDLEVLTQNTPALLIYNALGFKHRRMLDMWVRAADSTFPLPPRDEVQPLEVDGCLAAFDDFHSVVPPWQRDLPSLRQMAGTLRALGILKGRQVQAYLLYRSDGSSVWIADVATAPGQRTAMIESLLRALIRDRSGSSIRLVNLPQDDPASGVMYRIGAAVEMQQHEMTLEL